MSLLKNTFLQLATGYSGDVPLIKTLWQELEEKYSHRKRHYHTLAHLDHLLAVLTETRGAVSGWDCLLFTLYYHDAVYNATKSDNEEKSAELATARMQQLHVPAAMIERCRGQVLATKQHRQHEDADTNLFTDADLSILGQDWDAYARYASGVRKEYSMYPDLLYKPGRRKVLRHFLDMHRIYKTDYFYGKLEANARLNLQRELEQLL